MNNLNSNIESTHSRFAATQKEIPAQLLSKSISDLQTTKPLPGIVRFFLSAIPVFGALAISVQFEVNDWTFYLFGALAGLFFAASAVTSHDAIHHTLSGIEWFDEITARVVTWPAFWPHGLYSELHKLHHKMNGMDVRDPERVTFTEFEYKASGPLKRFYIRHQLWFSVFVAGGVGLIMEHLIQSKKFASQSRAIRRQFVYDGLGLLIVNGTIYGVAAAHNQAGKAFLLYFIIERIGGGLLQLRAHLEHYGIASQRANYFATQLYSCRNIKTNALMSWLMNRLNYHSLHHAFPKIPFYHLKEATRRIENVLSENGAEQLPVGEGYLRTFLKLSRGYQFVRLREKSEESL